MTDINTDLGKKTREELGKEFGQKSVGFGKHDVTKEDDWKRVWDEADYVVPPAENGAFFVTTNVVITPNQTRGYCPEVAAFVFFFSDSNIQLFWLSFDLCQR